MVYLKPQSYNEQQTIVIPACYRHEGKHAVAVRVVWCCPRCGRPRGRIKPGISLDGSRRLPVSDWNNPCGHEDVYWQMRKEAVKNGLNPGVFQCIYCNNIATHLVWGEKICAQCLPDCIESDNDLARVGILGIQGGA